SVIADYLKFNQGKLKNRLVVAVPLFVVSIILTQIDFDILWRYFSWANQTTSALALWIGTMYLLVKGKQYWISFIPALFITDMVLVYILHAPIGLRLPMNISHIGGLILTTAFTIWFFWKARQTKQSILKLTLTQRSVCSTNTTQDFTKLKKIPCIRQGIFFYCCICYSLSRT